MLRLPSKIVSISKSEIRYLGARLSSGGQGLLDVTQDDGVRRIVMSDDKTRNSLTLKMTEALLYNVTQQANDPKLRCIVISSKGPVFSGGHNLKELATYEGRKVFHVFGQLMMAIINCPVPVITAINGIAAAAGCQLVAQSDIAICSAKSTFSTPGANYGIFCSTPGIALARSTNRKTAAYMLFTGNTINAQEALLAGLVSKVVQDGLDEEINKVAESIKFKSRTVIEDGKKFFYKQLEMNLNEAYEEGAAVMEYALTCVDGIEGLRGFAEKRKPNWKNIR